MFPLFLLDRNNLPPCSLGGVVCLAFLICHIIALISHEDKTVTTCMNKRVKYDSLDGESASPGWKGATCLIYLYHISNNNQPACVQLIDFYWNKWGQEWMSSCLPGLGGPPAHQPLQWLIKTQALSHKKKGAFLSNSLGFPEILQ